MRRREFITLIGGTAAAKMRLLRQNLRHFSVQRNADRHTRGHESAASVNSSILIIDLA
jgi:hypothetical protein